jgi:acyl carrier protein
MENALSNADVVKEILCDILEIEMDELTEDGIFVDEYDADSLRAVEILAALERRFKVKIPEKELPNMENLRKVKEVLTRYGWQA